MKSLGVCINVSIAHPRNTCADGCNVFLKRAYADSLESTLRTAGGCDLTVVKSLPVFHGGEELGLCHSVDDGCVIDERSGTRGTKCLLCKAKHLEVTEEQICKIAGFDFGVIGRIVAVFCAVLDIGCVL